MKEAESGLSIKAVGDSSKPVAEDHLITCDVVFAGGGAARDHRHAPRVTAIHGSAACKTTEAAENTAKESVKYLL